jgi:LysM repeat protein
MEQNIS